MQLVAAPNRHGMEYDQGGVHLRVMLSLSKHDGTCRTLSSSGATFAASGCMLRQAQHDVSFDGLSMTARVDGVDHHAIVTPQRRRQTAVRQHGTHREEDSRAKGERRQP
ncbi:MAG: hypothetical protein HRF45_10055 [Fimbriimonadia bacterium]